MREVVGSIPTVSILGNFTIIQIRVAADFLVLVANAWSIYTMKIMQTLMSIKTHVQWTDVFLS